MLCLPRYAASGDAGDPGTDPMDDANDESYRGVADAGML